MVHPLLLLLRGEGVGDLALVLVLASLVFSHGLGWELRQLQLQLQGLCPHRWRRSSASQQHDMGAERERRRHRHCLLALPDFLSFLSSHQQPKPHSPKLHLIGDGEGCPSRLEGHGSGGPKQLDERSS